MADFEHYDINDPRHVTRGETFTLHNYMCVFCGATAALKEAGSPYCESCKAYSMKETGTIEDTKVAEIKSRKAPVSDPNGRKKGKKGRFDDGLVRELKGVVHPRVGKIGLFISVNMDKSAFLRGQTYMKFGTTSFLTSIEEVGAAFTPFDPTPAHVTVEKNGNAEQVTFDRNAVKGTTRLGTVEVHGGESPKRFKDGWVTFKYGKQKSTFQMSDIASVLINAL